MNVSRTWRRGRAGRLAGALVLAAMLVFGSGAHGATAGEPPPESVARTIDAVSLLGVHNQPLTTLQPTAVKSVQARRQDLPLRDTYDAVSARR